MIIRSVTVDGVSPFVGRNAIEFGPGMNVVYGRNDTGKSILFRGMRAWSRPVNDVSALPGWAADVTDCTEAWSGVPRLIVEVDFDRGEADGECVFLNGEQLARLEVGHSGASVTYNFWYGRLRQIFPHRLERMVGEELLRRGRSPRLRRFNDTLVLSGILGLPFSHRILTVLALALAIRDIDTPTPPLVIDDSVLGVLDSMYRRRVVRELTCLEGQVVLITGLDDIAELIGVDWVLAPFRHARGIRARRSTTRR